MRTHPAWLSYAEQIKSTVDALPNTSKAQERRERIVYLAYLIARERHRFAGTLGDWEFIIRESATPVVEDEKRFTSLSCSRIRKRAIPSTLLNDGNGS